MRSPLSMILLATSLLALSCGKSDSKEDQADDFYNKFLHTDDQKACNAGGHLYDALDVQCKDTVKLAAWECSLAGFKAHMVELKIDTFYAKNISDTEAKVGGGFEFHQCGDQADGGPYIVLIKKTTGSDQAAVEIQHVIFPLGGDSTKTDTSTDTSTDTGTQTGPTTLTLVGSSENVLRFCYDLTVKTDAPVLDDLVVTVTGLDTVLEVYTDAACKVPGGAATITKGESSTHVWYKFLSKVDWHLDATADGLEDGRLDLTPTGALVELRFTAAVPGAQTVGACNQGAVKYMEDGADASAQDDLAIALTAPDADFKVYSDAGCMAEVTSLTVANGQGSADFYVKFDSAGSGHVVGTLSGHDEILVTGLSALAL